MISKRFAPKFLTGIGYFGLYIAALSLGLRANRSVTYGANRSTERGNVAVPLNRDQVLLVMLSLAEGEPLTPVKVQKALFLAEDRVHDAFASHYNFQPYDYGPFDRSVYSDARRLSADGLIEIGSDPHGGWNTYAATPEGLRRGRELQQQLEREHLSMLAKIVQLVRSLSFTDLVSAIYRAYPAMRERSVFRD